jgi:hypothetical protein
MNGITDLSGSSMHAYLRSLNRLIEVCVFRLSRFIQAAFSNSVSFASLDAREENRMKRFVLVTALLTFIAGTFAAIAPASADKHGDRMRQDCKSGLRKC